MKKKFLLLMVLSASAAFADSYNGILTDDDFKELMASVSLDEFNSAVLESSSIVYDARHENTVFTANSPMSSNTEFRYSDGYSLSNLEVVENNPFTQLTTVIDTSDDKGSWVGINELSNPYDTSPGAINPTQNMAIQEHTLNYSETSSTATSMGWATTLGLSYEYKQSVGVVTKGVKISVETEVNGNETKTHSTTTGYTDVAKSFTVPVPAGCTAVVTQSLGSTTFSGEYGFSAILAKAQLKFNTITGTLTNNYTNSGYVDVVDLVKYGSIPQNALTVDSKGNLLINGKGTYVAKGASNYTVNVAYKEATLGTHYCMPVSEQAFNASLLETNARSSAGAAKAPVVSKTAHGFSYSVAYTPEHRKVAYQKSN